MLSLVSNFGLILTLAISIKLGNGLGSLNTRIKLIMMIKRFVINSDHLNSSKEPMILTLLAVISILTNAQSLAV